MPGNPFYKKHWIDIESERLVRYRRMFQWNPNQRLSSARRHSSRALLAQMRSADRPRQCLLFGADQTYRGHHETDVFDPKRTFALVATAFPTARSAAPEHHYVRSSGGIPKPVERGHVAIEQVAIAVVEALDDPVVAVSAVACILVAGILPESPTARCPS